MSAKTQLECLAVLFVWIRCLLQKRKKKNNKGTVESSRNKPAFKHRREYITKKVQTFGENFHSILKKFWTV